MLENLTIDAKVKVLAVIAIQLLLLPCYIDFYNLGLYKHYIHNIIHVHKK